MARRCGRSRRRRAGPRGAFPPAPVLVRLCRRAFASAPDRRRATHETTTARSRWKSMPAANGRPPLRARPRAAYEASKRTRAEAATDAQPVGPPREVKAAWYDVPDDSLAKRRAGREELTAAHNRSADRHAGACHTPLRTANQHSCASPIAGFATRTSSSTSVARRRRSSGMMSKGIARVKMEIVREENGSAPPNSQNAAPQP